MSTDGTLTEAQKIQQEVIPERKKSKAPDGGLAAWSVVLGSWCVLFCTFGWINSTNKPLPPRNIKRPLYHIDNDRCWSFPKLLRVDSTEPVFG